MLPMIYWHCQMWLFLLLLCDQYQLHNSWRDTLWVVLSNFCGSLKSTKHFTLLHFWYMYSKVTSHSLTSSYIAMWQSLFSLKSAICIHSLFSIHVPVCPVICKHRGCGFDESQTKEVLSVTSNIWRVFMQMLYNLTQNLVYIFDRTSLRILDILYFW